MGIPARLLGNGETELLHLRTHAKSMIRPTLVLLLIAAVAGVAVALIPLSWQPVAGWVVALGALAVPRCPGGSSRCCGGGRPRSP